MREHALDRLESLARERRDHGLAAQISQARAEAEAGQFTLAALGQFKRGKSTLLNALVGRPLLPMDVAPLTSTITVMAEGSPERGEVLFQNGQTRTVAFGDVAAFVTEEGNPGNRLGVQAVLLYLQSPLLSRGIRLVDTPGVGSVFGLNSAVTKAFLPRIDVALIVLGGDPPITGDELELVRSAAPRAGKLIFVMNKADLLDGDTAAKAEAFSRRVLAEALGRDPGPFLVVSARCVLRGGRDSGMEELQSVLQTLVAEAGPQLATLARSASAKYFAEQLGQAIALERLALVTPVDEMEARIQRFKGAVQDVEDLALAVPARIARSGGADPREDEVRREEFLRQEERKGVQSLRAALMEARSRAEVRRLVQPMVENFAQESIAAWLRQVSEESRHLLTDRAIRVEVETGRLAARVERAAAEFFDVPIAPCHIRRPEPDFERIPFEFVKPTMALDPQDWLFPVLERLLPGRMARALALRRAGGLLREWLRTNVYAIEARRVEVVDKAVRALQEDMVTVLHGIERAILEIIGSGTEEKRQGEQAIARRLGELDGQAQGIFDAIRTGEPAEHPPRP